MRKGIRRVLIGALLVVFLVCAGCLAKIGLQYRSSRKVYSDAVSAYTKPSSGGGTGSASSAGTGAGQVGDDTPDAPDETTDDKSGLICAPIEVDFDALMQEGADVFAWIYCEDTIINYPVVWGRDNQLYLWKNYRGEEDPCGSIFSDASNIKGVVDANIILYGHHMQDKSMFAILEKWEEQEFYDEHPVMWLLTPEQDYRIDLFSCYVTPGDSETYTIYREGGENFNEYLRKAQSYSQFSSPVVLDPDAHYVVLSTCAYSFYLARTVVHGMLVPVDSAGGVPLTERAE